METASRIKYPINTYTTSANIAGKSMTNPPSILVMGKIPANGARRESDDSYTQATNGVSEFAPKNRSKIRSPNKKPIIANNKFIKK